jgi:hypothetical protein
MSTQAVTKVSQLLFAVPETDHDEYQRLPEDVRADVDRLLIEFEKVHSARFIRPELKRLAELLGHRRGFKFSALRDKFYLYTNGGEKKTGESFAAGDWRCLIDKARCNKLQLGETDDADVNLPMDFVEHLKGLFQSNKRKSEPAIRLLYTQWKAGDSIPGYGTWQEWFMDNHEHYALPAECPPDLPRGWSRRNLRRYIPEDAELALAREGVSAARNLLPDVITTREGLRPLEVIMFDDVRTDFKILVPGYASPVEINMLVAIDVATGMVLRFGIRPGIIRDDGTRDKLKLMDMKHLVAGILTQYGVPRNYTSHFVVENATAALKDGTVLALKELSCDRIDVSRTMMVRGTAIWGGYMDKSLGNPKGKAALESTFNLFHNEAGFLPGQTGRRYDQGPMELAGREAEAKGLIRTSRHLTPHDRARLKMPFLTRDQARVVIADLWNHIIRRVDHCMEGFQPVGEWRNEKFQQWRPDHELAALGVDASAVEWRTPARLETPLERWDRLVEEVGGPSAFTKLHPGAVMRLYDDHARKEITNSEIVFKFKNEQFVYRIANVQSAKRPLQNEMEVLCYFDREEMSMIHLTDGEGAYLGSIPRTRGARRLDVKAVAEQIKASRTALNNLQETVSKRMPHVAEQHLAEIENNRVVVEEALKNQEAIDLAGTAAPQIEAPDVARDLLRAKLTQQLESRKAAARGEEPAAPAPAVPDCTQRLLDSESEVASGADETW